MGRVVEGGLIHTASPTTDCGRLRVSFPYSFSSSVVGFTSPRSRGRVKLAPPVPADAPSTVDSLAFGPNVTVLVQPDATKSAAPTSVTITFFILIRNVLYRGF